MKILGFVVMKQKRYEKIDRFIIKQFENMMVKIGSLEYEKKTPVKMFKRSRN